MTHSRRPDALGPPPSARSPYAVWALGMLCASGVVQFLSGAESGSVEALVPAWLALVWSVTLIAASGVILLGILMRPSMTALTLEAVGCVVLAPACVAFAWAIVNVTSATTRPNVVALIIGLALGCTWRLGQIILYLHRVRVGLRRKAETRGL